MNWLLQRIPLEPHAYVVSKMQKRLEKARRSSEQGKRIQFEVRRVVPNPCRHLTCFIMFLRHSYLLPEQRDCPFFLLQCSAISRFKNNQEDPTDNNQQSQGEKENVHNSAVYILRVIKPLKTLHQDP